MILHSLQTTVEFFFSSLELKTEFSTEFSTKDRVQFQAIQSSFMKSDIRTFELM